jgi:capsular exopolysaccharide synthesis family protein
MIPTDNTSDAQGNTPSDGLLPNAFGFSKLSAGDSADSRAFAPIPAGSLPKRRKPVERKLNIAELIKVMYRGRWIILTSFIVVFAYSVYSTYSKPYIYGSSTRMFLDKPPGGSQVAQIVGGDNQQDHSIANEVQFFRSHIVGQHVARLLHEYAEGNWIEIDSLFTAAFGSPKDLPPDPRQIAVIRINDNPKLPAKKGIADLGMLEARASSAVSIAPDGTNDYLLVTSEAYTPLDAAFLANLYVAVFVMDNQARVRENSANLKAYLFAQKERSFDTLRKVENRLREYLGETDGMSAEDIAKNVTNQYQDLKQKRASVEFDLSLRKKIYADYTANLDTVQKNYYDNLTLEPHVQMLQKQVTDLQFEIEGMKMNNNLMDPRTKKYLKDEIQEKQDRLTVLEDKLKEVTEQFLHSQVIVASEPSESNGSQNNGDITYATKGSSIGTITSLRQEILDTRLRIGQDSTLLGEYDEKLAALHAEAESMPEKIVETSSLKREEDVAEKMNGQLEDRYLEAWMTEESVFGNVKAEDPAGLNASPVRPNRQASIFTGALLGLAIGIGIVVVLSFLDSTIRTPDEVESHNISLLATIPVIDHPAQPLSIDPATRAGIGDRPKFTPHRASHLDPQSSVAESYRSLRTTVQFAGLDKEVQVLAISSSSPQEGKSTTSANLGIVMAQMGKRTLLIDADLRRPVLHSVFGLSREPGLTNMLFERSSWKEAIVQTDVPNLSILPCGIIPPNPAELLGSKRMGQLITQLRGQFDIIIIDTPPVVAVTDALLLGRCADATILVARADVTRIDGLLRAMDSVERSGANLLGVVLNNFNAANSYGSYYKYYQYYHYYSNKPVEQRNGISRLLRRRFKAATEKDA